MDGEDLQQRLDRRAHADRDRRACDGRRARDGRRRRRGDDRARGQGRGRGTTRLGGHAVRRPRRGDQAGSRVDGAPPRRADRLDDPRVGLDRRQGSGRDRRLDRPARDGGRADLPPTRDHASFADARTDEHGPPHPDRRGRRDHAVELPLRPRDALDRAGTRARQCRRPEAGRQHPRHRRRRDRAPVRGGGPAGRRPARPPGRRRRGSGTRRRPERRG